jgi:hypothetical protein
VLALVGIHNPRRRVRCADCQPPAVSTTGATLSAEAERPAEELEPALATPSG